MLTKHQFLKAYCEVSNIASLTTGEWNSLVRILRERSLLASYYHRLRQYGQTHLVPPACTDAFLSSINFASAQAMQTKIQGRKLTALFSAHQVPFIFLKGAAYILGEKSNSLGRLMTDIDICVERKYIEKAEHILINSGWSFKDMDEHDDKYYRKWSHEIPPLQHSEDGVVLDVHHTLIPPIKGRILDIERLVKSSKIADDSCPVPSIEWMVLHSALHLIINEDVENGLRDLTDIYLLLTNASPQKTLETEKLFVQEGFENEWSIVVNLLRYFFNFPIATHQNQPKTSKLTAMRCYVLKSALLPTSSYLPIRYLWLWKSINYVVGYLSKMPLSILIKQASYKSYRQIVKVIFGDYFFRKSKQQKSEL
ncbi:nucleotidyltransferase domain-containing protein [Alteromonas sp. P256]|uniref:nucleotidyltransferase domain-containing protein n=1 Tax=Alteromonas sp. P256 TaxID=3117399 RepID=UPI002FE41F23